MARLQNDNLDELSAYGRWLREAIKQRGVTIKQFDQDHIADESYLHKILSPKYRYYQRPGREKTIQIGVYLGDVMGGWLAAGYPLEELPARYQTGDMDGLEATQPHLASGNSLHIGAKADSRVAETALRLAQDYPHLVEVLGQLSAQQVRVIQTVADGLAQGQPEGSPAPGRKAVKPRTIPQE